MARAQKPSFHEIAALVASIKRYHSQVLRSEQEIHEWVIVSREVVARTREILVETEHAIRGLSAASPGRGPLS
jgi:hypothetical protein